MQNKKSLLNLEDISAKIGSAMYSTQPAEAKQDVTKSTIPRDIKNSVFKIVLEDPRLFAQLLQDFIPIGMLKEVSPEDIVTLSPSLISLSQNDRESDTVKKIALKGEEPLYIISMVEHQSSIDHNMSFRMLQYITLILENHVKPEQGTTDTRKLANFKYPPVLPIVLYDGIANWTACTNFKDRVEFADVFQKFIPTFDYLLISLRNLQFEELLENGTELSLILYIDKIREEGDFKRLQDISESLLHSLQNCADPWFCNLLKQVIELLLLHVNAPKEDIIRITTLIDEGRMDEMVEKVEWYDWQKTKEEALEEGREEGKLEGKLEGREEGKLEGRVEGKLEVAETLLAILEDEVIAESTKLPLSTIQELRRKKLVKSN